MAIRTSSSQRHRAELPFINKGNGTFEDQGLPLGVAYNDDAKAVSSMAATPKIRQRRPRGHLHQQPDGADLALYRNRGDFFRYVPEQVQLQQLSQPLSGWSAASSTTITTLKDLYSANGDIDNVKPNARQHDTMFRNLGGKQFVDVSDRMGAGFLHVGYQRGSAIGDLNNDGFEDLVVTSLMERPRILLNSGSNGNHWLTLELVAATATATPLARK